MTNRTWRRSVPGHFVAKIPRVKSKSDVIRTHTVVDLVIGVVLCPVVMGEFDEPLSIPDDISVRLRLGRVVAEEINVKLGVWEL